MHKVFVSARRDALFSAPFGNQERPRILDLGCGTGIWSLDLHEYVALVSASAEETTK
jgi:ubiquinone/menaquinone biosynthesis C-methylase UbiE